MKSSIWRALFENSPMEETQIGVTIGDWILKKLSVFQKATMSHCGETDGYQIYSQPHDHGGIWLVFFHEETPALISRIIDEIWHGRTYSRLQFVYISELYRGRQMMARLLWFIKQQMKMPIICDNSMSEPALKSIGQVKQERPNYFQIYWSDGTQTVPLESETVRSYVSEIGEPDSLWRLIIEHSEDQRFTPLFDTADSWSTQFYQIFESKLGFEPLSDIELFAANFHEPEIWGSYK